MNKALYNKFIVLLTSRLLQTNTSTLQNNIDLVYNLYLIQLSHIQHHFNILDNFF
jgi:hypothetical protein